MLLLLVFQPSFDHHHHHWRQKSAQNLRNNSCRKKAPLLRSTRWLGRGRGRRGVVVVDEAAPDQVAVVLDVLVQLPAIEKRKTYKKS